MMHREANIWSSTPVAFHFTPELWPGRMESLLAWILEGLCTENRQPRKCIVFLDYVLWNILMKYTIFFSTK